MAKYLIKGKVPVDFGITNDNDKNVIIPFKKINIDAGTIDPNKQVVIVTHGSQKFMHIESEIADLPTHRTDIQDLKTLAKNNNADIQVLNQNRVVNELNVDFTAKTTQSLQESKGHAILVDIGALTPVLNSIHRDVDENTLKSLENTTQIVTNKKEQNVQNDNFTKAIGALQNKANNNKQAIDDETQARELGDQGLDNRINDLFTQFADEKTIREDNDTSLFREVGRNQVQIEDNFRTLNDALKHDIRRVGTEIENETQARELADQGLNDRIDNISINIDEDFLDSWKGVS